MALLLGNRCCYGNHFVPFLEDHPNTSHFYNNDNNDIYFPKLPDTRKGIMPIKAGSLQRKQKLQSC